MTEQNKPIHANVRHQFLNGRILALPALIGALYLVLMAFPYPFFSHEARYQNIAVFSDQSISEAALRPVLSDVQWRLRKSSLNDPRLQHTVFICNSTTLGRCPVNRRK